MTPLETIVLVVVVGWVLRQLVVDGVRAGTGSGSGRSPGRYGMRGYLGEVWNDAWRSAGQRHRTRHAARAARRAAGEPSRAGRVRAAVAGWWRSAGGGRQRHVGPDGTVTETWRPGAWEAAWQRWEDRRAARAASRNRRNNDDPPDGGSTGAPGPASDRSGGQPGPDQPDVDRAGGPSSGQGPGSNPETDDVPRQGEADPAGQPQPRPGARVLDARRVGGRWIADEDPSAEVGGSGKENHAREGEQMSEATGLASALAHASAMRQAYEGSAADAESYTASLQAGGVHGTAVDAVGRAMEAQQQAAGAWAEAEAELQRHMQVREAYEANQGAGSREFVTSE